MSSFSQIAEELQVLIISRLDAESILMCREVSKSLRDLIDNSVVLQYQLELALVGMVDGPPSAVPTSERLEALRAFKATYSAGAHTTEEIVVSASQHADIFVPSSPAEIAYLDQNGTELVLKVYRISSTPCGTFSRTHETAFTGMGPFLAAHPGMGPENLFVDSRQGLLVYTFSTHENGPEGSYMRPHCSFATLSEGRIHWHQPNDPVAAYPSIVSCHEFILEPNPLEPPETWSRVQVFGDLVVWTAGEDYEDGSGLTEVIVHNWKTGRNVWHMHDDRYVGLYRVQLLSPSRLVMIHTFNLTIRLYEFDPECPTDIPPIRTLDDCLRILKLPGWFKRAPPAFLSECDTESFITHPPYDNTPETPQAMFLPDPTLATLVLRTELTYARREPVRGTSRVAYRREHERYLVFVPLATLMRCCEDRWPPQEGPGLDISDTDMPPVSNSTIPWEVWGPPLGARIVRAPEHPWNCPHSMHVRVGSVYSAELSHCYRGTIRSPVDCILSAVEVLPLAATSPPSHHVRLHAAASLEPPAEDEVSASSLSRSTSDENRTRGLTAWKAPFYTMYQIRKTERTIPYMTQDRKLLVGMRLVGDKLILFRSRPHGA
ncbi:hypothetical protein C8Q70DRAFT_1010823 [Cubamyces menziesii]|nr:hypothetical protein C8Q70DRAFT_1010823 [Cubamyces menziesii]